MALRAGWSKRLRVPNTRTGAILLAAGIGLVGFLLGTGIFVLAPLLRSTLGPGSPQLPTSARLLTRAGTPVTLQDPRPELWLTPIGSYTFPSAEHFARLQRAPGMVSATQGRIRGTTVFASPPAADPSGQKSVSVIATLSAADDWRTPGPARPVQDEPNQVTVVATPPGASDPAGCVLVARDDGLAVTGTIGAATTDACERGEIPAGEASLLFALEYDLLPNFRARSGAWMAGAVLGRVRLVGALTVP